MAAGLGMLRLAPSHFWAMTPRELAAAIEGVSGPRPPALNQNDLAGLMKRFPDKE